MYLYNPLKSNRWARHQHNMAMQIADQLGYPYSKVKVFTICNNWAI